MCVCVLKPTVGTQGVSHEKFPELHSDLDVIDWVNVLHGVLDDLAHLLQTLERPQGRHGVSLYHDVALRQELDCLERVSE